MSMYGPFLVDVMAFLTTLVAVYLVGNFLVMNLVSGWVKKRGLDETIHDVADSVAHILVVFAAFAIALTVAGFPSFLTAFATLGGALALAIGFASQELISNFVSGLFILKDKPFKKGDWIEWSNGSGTVDEIDLRVTRIKTFDNELITVSNSELANNAVKNPVAHDTLRLKFVFGIGYEDDIEEATSIIMEEARKHDQILEEPGPSVRLTELGDSSVGLQSRIWIKDPARSDFVKTRSTFVQNVKERFDEEGIDIPYPNRTLSGKLEVEEF
ncbi:mechanosensitive ion channel family protein [Candidatus Nanohalococcus occultus]|uniref:Small-conductance mechanosensitive channel n=1 Tax=Candidatus Nanohalococcus occultus TaxID=2978047 RepID=A0ABY8CE65_9ARCH|nr:Small-conductance mechanosensitive channel [Candidatus Nanohaloarchaeota archaeon SVXNc]